MIERRSACGWCPALAVVLSGSLVTLAVLVSLDWNAVVDVDHGVRELSADILRSANWLPTALDLLAGPGGSGLLAAGMLGIIVVLLIRRRFRDVLWVVLAIVVQFAAEVVLEVVVARPPSASGDVPEAESGFSFPSGHTASAMVLLTLLLAVLPHGRVTWWLVVPPALVLAVAIGASRVLAQAHHFSDVVGGALLGLLVGSSVACRINRSPRGSSAEMPTPAGPPVGIRPPGERGKEN